MSRNQILLAAAGVACLAATVLCAPHARTWADQYIAYFERMNTGEEPCPYGPPSHCYRAEAAG